MITDENLLRELRKIRDVMVRVSEHLDAKDRMNAALHMSEIIRSTPLSSAVGIALNDLGTLIREAENV